MRWQSGPLNEVGMNDEAGACTDDVNVDNSRIEAGDENTNTQQQTSGHEDDDNSHLDHSESSQRLETTAAESQLPLVPSSSRQDDCENEDHDLKPEADAAPISDDEPKPRQSQSANKKSIPIAPSSSKKRAAEDMEGGGSFDLDDENDDKPDWKPQNAQSTCEFTHTILNYSQKRESGCKKAEYSATTVDPEGNRWRLIVYVNGNGRASNHHLSLFLQVADADELPFGWKKAVSYVLTLEHPSGSNMGYAKRNPDKTFKLCPKAIDWGWSQFITSDRIQQEGYVSNDTLTVRASVTVKSSSVSIDPDDAELYLKSAVEEGNAEAVRTCLDQGAGVNCKFKDDLYTPLHTACSSSSSSGSLEVLNLLLEKGADGNACNKWRESPLLIAANNGHRAAVEALLKHGADPSLCSEAGWSALTFASHKGYDNIVELLLEAGAPVNCRVTEDLSTPLHKACAGSKKGHVSAVKQLLANGADVHALNKWRETPLLTAANHGQAGAVEALLKEGGDPGKCTDTGWSPLSIAAYKGHDDVVKLLLEEGAPTEEADPTLSALLQAATKGLPDTVDLLLRHGADHTVTTKKGDTALSILVEQNLIDAAVEMVTEYKASIPRCSRDRKKVQRARLLINLRVKKQQRDGLLNISDEDETDDDDSDESKNAQHDGVRSLPNGAPPTAGNKKKKKKKGRTLVDAEAQARAAEEALLQELEEEENRARNDEAAANSKRAKNKKKKERQRQQKLKEERLREEQEAAERERKREEQESKERERLQIKAAEMEKAAARQEADRRALEEKERLENRKVETSSKTDHSARKSNSKANPNQKGSTAGGNRTANSQPDTQSRSKGKKNSSRAKRNSLASYNPAEESPTEVSDVSSFGSQTPKDQKGDGAFRAPPVLQEAMHATQQNDVRVEPTTAPKLDQDPPSFSTDDHGVVIDSVLPEGSPSEGFTDTPAIALYRQEKLAELVRMCAVARSRPDSDPLGVVPETTIQNVIYRWMARAAHDDAPFQDPMIPSWTDENRLTSFLQRQFIAEGRKNSGGTAGLVGIESLKEAGRVFARLCISMANDLSKYKHEQQALLPREWSDATVGLSASEMRTNGIGRVVVIDWSSRVQIHLPTSIFSSLRSRYIGKANRLLTSMFAVKKRYEVARMLVLGTNLDCQLAFATRESLSRNAAVTVELWTNPLQAHEQNAVFGVFPDVDAPFGGFPPFASSEPSKELAIFQNGVSGAVMLPFDNMVASTYVRRIVDLLVAGDNDGVPLSFVVFFHPECFRDPSRPAVVTDLAIMEPRLGEQCGNYVRCAEVLPEENHAFANGDGKPVICRSRSLFVLFQNEAGHSRYPMSDASLIEVIRSMSIHLPLNGVDAVRNSPVPFYGENLNHSTPSEPSVVTPFDAGAMMKVSVQSPVTHPPLNQSNFGTIGGPPLTPMSRQTSSAMRGRLFDLIDDGDDEVDHGVDVVSGMLSTLDVGAFNNSASQEIDIEAISLMGIGGAAHPFGGSGSSGFGEVGRGRFG